MTNVEETGAQTSIERQALKWLVRMDSDTPLSDEEKKALRKWMSRNVLHRRELTRIARFWDKANILTELAGLEYERRQSVDRCCRRRRWAILMTAACVSASSIILTHCSAGTTTGTRTYGMAIGQQKRGLLSEASPHNKTATVRSKCHTAIVCATFADPWARGEGHFTLSPALKSAFEVMPLTYRSAPWAHRVSHSPGWAEGGRHGRPQGVAGSLEARSRLSADNNQSPPQWVPKLRG